MFIQTAQSASKTYAKCFTKIEVQSCNQQGITEQCFKLVISPFPELFQLIKDAIIEIQLQSTNRLSNKQLKKIEKTLTIWFKQWEKEKNKLNNYENLCEIMASLTDLITDTPQLTLFFLSKISPKQDLKYYGPFIEASSKKFYEMFITLRTIDLFLQKLVKMFKEESNAIIVLRTQQEIKNLQNKFIKIQQELLAMVNTLVSAQTIEFEQLEKIEHYNFFILHNKLEDFLNGLILRLKKINISKKNTETPIIFPISLVGENSTLQQIQGSNEQSSFEEVKHSDIIHNPSQNIIPNEQNIIEFIRENWRNTTEFFDQL